MVSPTVLEDLRTAVGDEHVLVDADLVAGYERDWTGRFVGRTAAVVRPGSTSEVLAVVERLRRDRIPVVPQGGNTGLVGGSVPLHGEVVLSTRRLTGIGPIDRDAHQVTVEAGVTLADLQERVKPLGLAPGVDLAARGTATIGGMVATNAGGIHVVRNGPMRAQVVGVEAVTGSGLVISRLSGLEKDNTGYDLGSLLCGSEGTLGVVTRVRLRLVEEPRTRVVALVGVDGWEAAVSLVGRLRGMRSLNAIEALGPATVALVATHLGRSHPFGRDAVAVLVEAVDGDDPAADLADRLGDDGVSGDALVATGPGGQLNLWALREAATEALSARGTPIKMDVTLPSGELAGFAHEAGDLVAAVAPQAETHLFGHLGDGNLHVNVLHAERRAAEVEEVVFHDVARRGGSISAEHGIGTAKARWLHLARSDDELAAARAIRAALDPEGILNPHVLAPPRAG